MYSHLINIESDINNISLMEEVTQSIVDKHSLSAEKFPVILIALTEAVSNSILHGNCESTECDVEIFTKQDNSGIYIRVKDQGKGFDFTNLPDPTQPDTIEEEGGRGILLISELSDEISFHDQGCVIEMFFKN